MTSGSNSPELRTERMRLTPLRPADAEEMVKVLADPAMYAFTGGEPPGLPDLQRRYRAQIVGPSEPGATWHNWILRLADAETEVDAEAEVAVGYVQATVAGDAADVAWVVGTSWQRQGLAAEAAMAMCRWLRQAGVERLTAHIHPDHQASARVASAIGLHDSGELDDDGEAVWI